MSDNIRRSDRELRPAAKKCLAGLLDAELDGAPVEFHTWRAQNAKKIPLLRELQKHGAIGGREHCEVTFYGLMITPGDRARLALVHCERVFKALRKWYPKNPKSSLSLEELSQLAKLPRRDTLSSAYFLSRSPIFLSVHTNEQKVTIAPNERYVIVKGFEEIRGQAREESVRAQNAALVPLSLAPASESHLTLVHNIEISRCEMAREAWQKANQRLLGDPAGAITAARSMAEAACKYILEENGVTPEPSWDLPRLYKKTAEVLRLEPRSELVAPLNRALQGCAIVIDALAEIRNKLGDAHGKGRDSVKPARRHAQFVVMLAGGMVGLLLATEEARRP